MLGKIRTRDASGGKNRSYRPIRAEAARYGLPVVDHLVVTTRGFCFRSAVAGRPGKGLCRAQMTHPFRIVRAASCGSSRAGPVTYRYLPRQPHLDVLAAWFLEAVRAAEPRGVKLAAENHGDYTAREMLWLVEAVGSPYFGVNFDSGNFLRLLDDPLAAMELLRPYVLATHIKDLKVRPDVPASAWYFFSSTPVGEGLIDISGLTRSLAHGGYDGLLAVEIDHLHPDYGYEEHAAVRQSIDELRRRSNHVVERPKIPSQKSST